MYYNTNWYTYIKHIFNTVCTTPNYTNIPNYSTRFYSYTFCDFVYENEGEGGTQTQQPVRNNSPV